MKQFFVLATLFALALRCSAADAKPPFIGTFYVQSVRCGKCIDSINEKVVAVPGVVQLRGVYDWGYVLIWFDPAKASHHQIAQAIADAEPMHGDHYIPFLMVSIPEYAMHGNKAKVDAVLARFEKHVEFEHVNDARGDFNLRFLPLKRDAQASGPAGFRMEELEKTITAPPPAGLGLKFELSDELKKRKP